jgi:phospholipid/cholesterol/gamma-HCH transport system substrate-binding protein
VSRKAGLLVAIAGTIALAALVLAGRVQGWFRTVELKIDLPEEGSYGLRSGSEVQILGIVIGQVTEVHVTPAGKLQGTVKITDPGFMHFIRRDSQVIIKKKFAIAGDAYIEFTKGTGAALDPQHEVLHAMPDQDIVHLLQDFTAKVQDEVMPTLEKVRALVEGHAELVAYLNRPDGPFRASLDELHGALVEARKASTALPDIAGSAKDGVKKVPELVDRVGKILDETNGLVVQLREMTADLKVVSGAVRDETKDLPGTVLQLQDLLRQLDRLMVGLQRHWLIRGYVPPDYSGGRIPPGDVDLGGGR